MPKIAPFITKITYEGLSHKIEWLEQVEETQGSSIAGEFEVKKAQDIVTFAKKVHSENERKLAITKEIINPMEGTTKTGYAILYKIIE